MKSMFKNKKRSNGMPIEPLVIPSYATSEVHIDSQVNMTNGGSEMDTSKRGSKSDIPFGPENILPRTVDAISKSDNIRAKKSENTNEDQSVVYLDPLPAGTVLALPLQALNFKRRRAHHSPGEEQEYGKRMKHFVARYEKALSEIQRRYPDEERAPKSGRTGNDPDSQIPHDGKRVVIEWNRSNLPIGEWGSHFNNFLGCLSRRSDYFNPIFFWPSQPFRNLEAAWNEIQNHFVLDNNASAWDYVFTVKMPKMIQDYKTKLKKKVFLAYQTDWERFWNLDPHVDPVQFSALCFYWESKVSTLRSERGKHARSFNEINHHGGTQTIAQLSYKLEQKNKKPVNIDDLARVIYNCKPDYDNPQMKKKKEVLIESISRSVQEAVLRSQSQNEQESGAPCKLSIEVEDCCVEGIFGPSKKWGRRMEGVGARRPSKFGTSSTTSTSEAKTANLNPELMNIQNKMQMMQDMLLSLVSTLNNEQKTEWTEKMASIERSSACGSNSDKERHKDEDHAKRELNEDDNTVDDLFADE